MVVKVSIKINLQSSATSTSLIVDSWCPDEQKQIPYIKYIRHSGKIFIYSLSSVTSIDIIKRDFGRKVVPYLLTCISRHFVFPTCGKCVSARGSSHSFFVYRLIRTLSIYPNCLPMVKKWSSTAIFLQYLWLRHIVNLSFALILISFQS